MINDDILDDNTNISKDIVASLCNSYKCYNLINNSNEIRSEIVRYKNI